MDKSNGARCLGSRPKPQISDAVYYYGMSISGASEWNILWERYLNETDEVVRYQYRDALCQVPVPWIIQYMLEVADKYDLISFIDSFYGNDIAVPIVWNFVIENTEYLLKTYRNGGFPYILRSITESFSTTKLLHEVEMYFQGIPQQSLGQSDRQFILNRMQRNIHRKEINLIPLTNFFKESVSSNVY